MASGNVTVELVKDILSYIKEAEKSLAQAKQLIEPLLNQFPEITNDEPLRIYKGRAKPRPRADSGYTDSMDSSIINPTSVTSFSFDNLQELPEKSPGPEVEYLSEPETIQTSHVRMRSRSEGDNSSNSGQVPYRRSGSEHEDQCRRKESDEDFSL